MFSLDIQGFFVFIQMKNMKMISGVSGGIIPKAALCMAHFWHCAALWGGTFLALYGTLNGTISLRMKKR